MNNKWKRIILWSSFFLILTCSVITTWHISNNLLDDDASAELVLAKCLYDEKSLISKDFVYSTEFSINNQIIYAFLFSIFSDWTLVRFWGTLIIQLIALVSLVFLLRSAGLSAESILFGCVLFLLPYCVAYGRIVLYHCYYTPFVSYAFLIVGLFFRALRQEQSKLILAVLCILCIWSCTNGVRIFVIVMLPLCGLGFLYMLLTKNRKYFILSLVCAAGGLIGLFLNALILREIHIEVEYKRKLAFKGVSDAIVVLFAILKQFGYRSLIDKSSFLGIMSLCGIIPAVFGFYTSGKSLLCEKKLCRFTLKGMLLVQMGLSVGIFLFYALPYNSRYDYSRYLVLASVWMIPLFCCVFSERKSHLFRLSGIAAAVVFVANGLINLCFFNDPELFKQEYDGLIYTSTGVTQEYSAVVDFIRNSDYDLGYAVYDPNVLTEMLDGFPVVGIDKHENGFLYRDQLSRKSFRTMPSQKAFILFNYVDALSFRALPISEGSELVLNVPEGFYLYELKDPQSFQLYLMNESKR